MTIIKAFVVDCIWLTPDGTCGPGRSPTGEVIGVCDPKPGCGQEPHTKPNTYYKKEEPMIVEPVKDAPVERYANNLMARPHGKLYVCIILGNTEHMVDKEIANRLARQIDACLVSMED